MIFGVGFYSLTIGNLSSILSNIDSRDQKLAVNQILHLSQKEKMLSLSEFANKTKLPDELYLKIKKTLE